MRLCHKTKVSYDALFSGQSRADPMVCIYLREDGYLRGTLYVSRCARERMVLSILYGSLCPVRSYLLSEARCSTWVLEEPIRRCQMGTGLSFALFYRVVCAAD